MTWKEHNGNNLNFKYLSDELTKVNLGYTENRRISVSHINHKTNIEEKQK